MVDLGDIQPPSWTVHEFDVNAAAPSVEAKPMLGLMLRSSSPHDAPSSPRADARAAALVHAVPRQLAPVRGRVLLTPRRGWWLSNERDAVRLAMRVNRPEVGLSLSVSDWVAAGASDPDAMLDLVGPRSWDVRVEDESLRRDARVGELFARLRRMGYAGTISGKPDLGTPRSG